MLRIDSLKHYIVYPPWAEFTYRWDNLLQILSDPLSSGYLERDKPWAKYGFPPKVQPFELLSGGVNNGIIIAHTGDHRWLPGIVLSKEADIIQPDRIGLMLGIFEPPVYYLRPRRTGEVMLGLERPKKKFLCSFGIEHVETEAGISYWIVLSKGDISKETKRIEEIGANFRLNIQQHTDLPTLPASFMDWLEYHGGQCTCFRVQHETDDVGFLLASMYYTGFYLKSVLPRKISHLCLAASVEGKPSISKYLKRRQPEPNASGG